MKKIYIPILVLALLISFVGIMQADSINQFFLKDNILENDLNAKVNTTVSIDNIVQVSDIKIVYTSEVSVDGGIVFKVKNSEEKEIGTFGYKAWLEKNPIYTLLPNGDVILGANNLYKKDTKKIENLCPSLDNALLDYAVTNDKIAFIGSKSADPKMIYIYIKDLITGKLDIVDTFKFPASKYPANVYVAWDKSGNLYYDFYTNSKPVIKSYNKTLNQTAIAFNSAMNPQASPDGQYMVYQSTDGLNISDQTYAELLLYNISEKTNINKLKGNRHILWADGAVITKDVEAGRLEVYSLKDNGKKIKDIETDCLPFEVTKENGKFKLKSYKFTNNKIVLENTEF